MQNQINIDGIITETPILKKNKSNSQYVFFTIENKQEDSTHLNLIDCMAWKSNAEFIAMNLKKGQNISISGKLMTMTKDKTKSTYIKVENAYTEVNNESTPIYLEDTETKNTDEMPF